jgi:diguanylate cyclase (GGDEF)-like protein
MRSITEADRRTVEVALLAAFRGVPASYEIGVGRTVEVQRCELTFRPMTTGSGGVDGVIVCATDVTDRCRLRAELEHRAWHDPLTGCLNRAGAVIALERALAESEDVAVAYIDLDDFKVTNDQLGHAAGDELLKIAAARLSGVMRSSDQLGRLGGDEFVLICRQSDRAVDPHALVDRLTQAIEGDVVIATRRVRLTASVGAAVARKGEVDVEALLHRADTAMYRAKRGGRRAADVPTFHA